MASVVEEVRGILERKAVAASGALDSYLDAVHAALRRAGVPPDAYRLFAKAITKRVGPHDPFDTGDVELAIQDVEDDFDLEGDRAGFVTLDFRTMADTVRREFNKVSGAFVESLEDDLDKSLSGLARFNDGLWKSEKQARFLLGRIHPDEASKMWARKQGFTGSDVQAFHFMKLLSQYGRKDVSRQRFVGRVFVVDNGGVLAMAPLKFKLEKEQNKDTGELMSGWGVDWDRVEPEFVRKASPTVKVDLDAEWKAAVAANAETIALVKSIPGWEKKDFLQDMLRILEGGDKLTPGQLAAVQRMVPEGKVSAIDLANLRDLWAEFLDIVANRALVAMRDVFVADAKEQRAEYDQAIAAGKDKFLLSRPRDDRELEQDFAKFIDHVKSGGQGGNEVEWLSHQIMWELTGITGVNVGEFGNSGWVGSFASNFKKVLAGKRQTREAIKQYTLLTKLVPKLRAKGEGDFQIYFMKKFRRFSGEWREAMRGGLEEGAGTVDLEGTKYAPPYYIPALTTSQYKALEGAIKRLLKSENWEDSSTKGMKVRMVPVRLSGSNPHSRYLSFNVAARNIAHELGIESKHGGDWISVSGNPGVGYEVHHETPAKVGEGREGMSSETVKTEALGLGAMLAVGDQAAAEDAVDAEIIDAFKKNIRRWTDFLEALTGAKWAADVGEMTVEFNEDGTKRSVGVYWDYDVGSQRVTFYVEGPKGTGTEVFRRKAVIEPSKSGAPAEFLGWLERTLREALEDERAPSLVEEVRGILEASYFVRTEPLDSYVRREGHGGMGAVVAAFMKNLDKGVQDKFGPFEVRTSPDKAEVFPKVTSWVATFKQREGHDGPEFTLDLDDERKGPLASSAYFDEKEAVKWTKQLASSVLQAFDPAKWAPPKYEGMTEGMRGASEEEFLTALANAGWPAPEYAHTKRTMDVYYKDRGTEVAHKTQLMKRGKVSQEMWLVNPDYLKGKTEAVQRCSVKGCNGKGYVQCNECDRWFCEDHWGTGEECDEAGCHCHPAEKLLKAEDVVAEQGKPEGGYEAKTPLEKQIGKMVRGQSGHWLSQGEMAGLVKQLKDKGISEPGEKSYDDIAKAVGAFLGKKIPNGKNGKKEEGVNKGWDPEQKKYVDPKPGQVALFDAELGQKVFFDENAFVWQGDPEFNPKTGEYGKARVKKIRAKDVKPDESVFDNPKAAMRDVEAWLRSEDRASPRQESKIPGHLWVISRDSTGKFIVSIGDPTDPHSTLKRRFQTLADLKDWIKYDMRDMVSPKHVYDATGLKLVPGSQEGEVQAEDKPLVTTTYPWGTKGTETGKVKGTTREFHGHEKKHPLSRLTPDKPKPKKGPMTVGDVGQKLKKGWKMVFGKARKVEGIEGTMAEVRAILDHNLMEGMASDQKERVEKEVGTTERALRQSLKPVIDAMHEIAILYRDLREFARDEKLATGAIKFMETQKRAYEDMAEQFSSAMEEISVIRELLGLGEYEEDVAGWEGDGLIEAMIDAYPDLITKELEQFRHSLDLMKKDPEKYKPQIDNAEAALRNISRYCDVAQRKLRGSRSEAVGSSGHPLTEGFFSWLCPECRKAIMSPYSDVTKAPDWMNKCVLVDAKDGSVLAQGAYDGYGRIADKSGEYEIYQHLKDGEIALYHEKCWQQRDPKAKVKASKDARDQGFFGMR